ncbi:MAG TPA: helix-turn-helix domain-containing protein [Candidatus Saccharimonadales bacterium]|nr:helix-turn-helix domain-containing protein [Candidatus Saccharimonadales bacterium]
MRDIAVVLERLQRLGLSEKEAEIFLALLDGPKTPVEVSRLTGIARSNVYRIVDAMSDAGLLGKQTTDEGQMLVAADPASLELLVVEQEHRAKEQREGLGELLVMLEDLVPEDKALSIKAFRGLSGLKQMLWNELKLPGEVLIFSSGSHNAATGKRWAEKYRAEVVARGIVQRCIVNPWPGAETLTSLPDYSRSYLPHYIAPEVLQIRPEIAIHEDTVFIYNPWDHEVQLGVEIANPYLATFLRNVFEHYWLLASEDPAR